MQIAWNLSAVSCSRPDKQTNRQCDRRRQIHYLLGWGNTGESEA